MSCVNGYLPTWSLTTRQFSAQTVQPFPRYDTLGYIAPAETTDARYFGGGGGLSAHDCWQLLRSQVVTIKSDSARSGWTSLSEPPERFAGSLFRSGSRSPAPGEACPGGSVARLLEGFGSGQTSMIVAKLK